jgi:hypothetical protein
MTTENLPDRSTNGAGRKSGPWSQERRLEFIDYRLQWDGRLNRSDLIDFFGISVPQASLDIAKYNEIAPANMEYDRSARTYNPSATFRAALNTGDPRRLLNDLLISAAGLDSSQGSFLSGSVPIPTAIAPIPTRLIDVDMLLPLLHAIRSKATVGVTYQSMTSENPVSRTLSPHSFAFDGFRWHVRAYCHVREQFRDFLLSRMLEVTKGEPSPIRPEADTSWQTFVTLVFEPDPGLPKPQRKVIELDYGMINGEATLQCRQALLFYTLKHLGLASSNEESSPQTRQVRLKNADTIDELMAKLAKYVQPMDSTPLSAAGRANKSGTVDSPT